MVIIIHFNRKQKISNPVLQRGATLTTWNSWPKRKTSKFQTLQHWLSSQTCMKQNVAEEAGNYKSTHKWSFTTAQSEPKNNAQQDVHNWTPQSIYPTVAYFASVHFQVPFGHKANAAAIVTEIPRYNTNIPCVMRFAAPDLSTLAGRGGLAITGTGGL